MYWGTRIRFAGLTTLDLVTPLSYNFPFRTFRKNSSLIESGLKLVPDPDFEPPYLFHNLSLSVKLVEETKLESMKFSTWFGHIHRSCCKNG